MSLLRLSSWPPGWRSSGRCGYTKSVMILVSCVTKLSSLASSLRSRPCLTIGLSSLGFGRLPSGESPSFPASSCASRSSRCAMLRKLSGCLACVLMIIINNRWRSTDRIGDCQTSSGKKRHENRWFYTTMWNIMPPIWYNASVIPPQGGTISKPSSSTKRLAMRFSQIFIVFAYS